MRVLTGEAERGGPRVRKNTRTKAEAGATQLPAWRAWTAGGRRREAAGLGSLEEARDGLPPGAPGRSTSPSPSGFCLGSLLQTPDLRNRERKLCFTKLLHLRSSVIAATAGSHHPRRSSWRRVWRWLRAHGSGQSQQAVQPQPWPEFSFPRSRKRRVGFLQPCEVPADRQGLCGVSSLLLTEVSAVYENGFGAC